MKYFFKVVGCLSLMLFSSQGAYAECIVKPSGIFSSNPGRGDAVASSPVARGVLIRATWDELENAPGRFDFSRIDSQLEQFKLAGKKWSLAVVAGPSTPNWVKREASGDIFRLTFRGTQKVTVPYFWNDYVQERLGVLAQALGERYGDDEDLALVYVPQMTINGIEGHFNGVKFNVLRHGGLTEGRWVYAVQGAATSFAKAFPDKPVAVELHELYDSVKIPRAIIKALESDSSLKDQIGYGVWWLSGKDSYQSDLLKYMARVNVDIYGQLIGNSSQPNRFEDGTLQSAFDQAQELGMRYIEAWNYEFENDVEMPAMEAFDTWANDEYPSSCD